MADAQLSALKSKTQWDALVMVAAELAAVKSKFAQLETFVNIEDGMPGMSAHTARAWIGGGPPESRANPLATPGTARPATRGEATDTYQDFRKILVLTDEDYNALLWQGQGGDAKLMQLAGDALVETYSVIFNDFASRLTNATSATVRTGIPVPALNTATGVEQIAKNHTLSDVAGSTFQNFTAATTLMTQTTVKAAVEAFKLELSPWGTYTNVEPRILVGQNGGLMHEICNSIYGSSALQANPNYGMRPVAMPGLGTKWALFAERSMGGLTIGFSGGYTAETSGRPFVGEFVRDRNEGVWKAPYGCKYAVIAAKFHGSYFVNY